MPHDLINQAQQVLGRGESNLIDVLPKFIERIIDEQLWRECKTKEGEPFHSFQHFCEYKLWWGLECPIDRMVDYCKYSESCTKLLLSEVPALAKNGEIGRGRNSCNNITANSRGNDSTYTLKRLKRDHPELANAVINGELSANAAAIQAGFRKPSITINPDPESAAAAIRRKFGDDFSVELGKLLLGQDTGYNHSVVANASLRDS